MSATAAPARALPLQALQPPARAAAGAPSSRRAAPQSAHAQPLAAHVCARRRGRVRVRAVGAAASGDAGAASSSADVVAPPGSTVLVAGAAGGVGQLVVAKLLERGYRVRALVRSAARAADAAALFGAPVPAELALVAADLRDAGSLRASGVLAGVDAVVCCTGTTAFPSARWRDGNGPRETDQIGVSNLVAAAHDVSPRLRRFVLVSSVGVLRTGQLPYSILNAFGVLTCKRAAEEALLASGLPATILRPGRLTDGPYTSYDLNTLLRATSGARRAVQMATGDTLNPEATSRLVVAEAAVQALAQAATVGKDFDLGSTEGEGPGTDGAAWALLFAAAGRLGGR